MADVIKLSDHRKKEVPTLKELVDRAVEMLQSEWERFAKVNRLNDFFTEATSAWTSKDTNYLGDLNAVAGLEAKIGLNVLVRAPLAAHNLGWQAAFYTKTSKIHTPELPFETYARCFNVLLFLKLKRDLISHGLVDEM